MVTFCVPGTDFVTNVAPGPSVVTFSVQALGGKRATYPPNARLIFEKTPSSVRRL